jgi:thymidine kinase
VENFLYKFCGIFIRLCVIQEFRMNLQIEVMEKMLELANMVQNSEYICAKCKKNANFAPES